MDENLKSKLNLQTTALYLVAIGGSTILVSAALKLLFSSNVDLEVLDARLQLSNQKLALAKEAIEIKQLADNNAVLLQQIKFANQQQATLNDGLIACNAELEEILPRFDNFPRVQAEPIEPIPEQDLKQAEQQLEKSQEGIEKNIDKLFEVE